MRINIITGAFIPLPPAGCGAVERVWHGLAQKFAEKGHTVTFYSRAHPAQPHDETTAGVRYVRRWQFKQTRSAIINILIKDSIYALSMLSILEPADILICNDFCTGIFYHYYASKRAGKLVLNIQRTPKRIMAAHYRSAECLTAVSEAVREAMAEVNPLLLTKTRVIPNPIYTEIFRQPQNPRTLNGPQTLLYTGRIHPEKGLHLLTDAFEQIHSEFPQVRLKMVGPWRYEHGGGGPDYLNSLLRNVRNLPIEVVEPINDVDDLAKLIQCSHYYCYPSLAERGETFGVAALEASACGIPPVVSDLKCFREFVEDGVNGFVFNHRAADPASSLAATLRYMLSNAEQLGRMRLCAAETAAKFSYENVANSYLEIFEHVL